METINTPEQTARELMKLNCSIEDYERVQSQRNVRLKYWQKHGIQVLIENEEAIIKFGEKVLSLLKEAYKP